MVQIGKVKIGEFPLILSPMDEITDVAFRSLCKPFGVDLMMTEFIASDALIRGIEKSMKKLQFAERERPIAIQIVGREEAVMCEAAKIAEQFSPDMIDINWGCPVKKVAGKGAGSGILNDIPKMIQISKAVVESVRIPVTVKTRLGYDESSKPIVSIAEQLQDVGVSALSIHGRTRSQMYKGSADWTLIGEVKNNPRMQIPIFGNGDVDTPEKALAMKNAYGVDGILIGRASIGNPWIFKQVRDFLEGGVYTYPDVKERVSVCRRHLIALAKHKGEGLAVLEMRKHYSSYFSGLENFKPLRIELLGCTQLEEVLVLYEQIVQRYATA